MIPGKTSLYNEQGYNTVNGTSGTDSISLWSPHGDAPLLTPSTIAPASASPSATGSKVRYGRLAVAALIFTGLGYGIGMAVHRVR